MSIDAKINNIKKMVSNLEEAAKFLESNPTPVNLEELRSVKNKLTHYKKDLAELVEIEQDIFDRVKELQK
jgi:ferritin